MKPRVQPAGIGDLLVVKQNTLGYEAAELAETRNIMSGEFYEKSTRSFRRQEVARISRSEVEAEELNERKSTERFELAQEARKTILSETSFNAGAEVSASYGPFSASAYFDFSQTDSTTQSNVNSTKYAREVVERSVKRIVEKTFDERRDLLIEEFEENNLNRFENGGGQNRSGLYFWLNKIVRLKVMNYGKRVFYRFYVPEPAAFYLMARTQQRQNDLPEEPPFPTVNGQELKPSHVTRGRWRNLVAKVKASGVSPPPPKTRYVTKHISREFRDSTSHFLINPTQLEIPKGYYAERIDGIGTWYNPWATSEASGNRNYDLDLIIGKTHHSIDRQETEVEYDPDAVFGEVGSVPIGLQFDSTDSNYGVFSAYAAVRIKCKLDKQAFRQWQIETYDAIINAYNNLRADYEEQLAQASVSGGFQVAGQHPEINRQTELTELKKGCITAWTGFRYDHAHGINHNEEADAPHNYPEINLDNAEALAKDVDLLENGFEWENASYEFEPYYWGRKRKWLDMQEYDDPDPLFRAFLQAGAAIVTVPVKPEYSRRILHFQLTGQHAADDNVPTFHTGSIDNTFVDLSEDNRDEEFILYHSYIREIEAQEPFENLDNEIDIAADDPDAWEVSIPLPMVYLSPDSDLPSPDDA